MNSHKSIFEKFGGIRPMAEKLGQPPSTIKTWHTKRAIPRWWHKELLETAERIGLQVTADEIENIRADSEPFRRGPPTQAQAA